MRKCKECGYEGDDFLKGFLICNTCVERYNNKKLPNPKKLQEYCRPRGEEYQYYNIDEIFNCINVWIDYFNELGDYFEKRGNQERADRHYSQAVVMKMLIGEER